MVNIFIRFEHIPIVEEMTNERYNISFEWVSHLIEAESRYEGEQGDMGHNWINFFANESS